MESSEELRLLEARTFMVLDAYAESLGISISKLFVDFSENKGRGAELADSDARVLYSHAFIAWSFYTESKSNGVTRMTLADVIDWARFCGYLSGALKISGPDSRFDPVLNGKKGIEKRYAPMRQLKTWAVEKYQSGKWSSANAAAVALEEQVIAHGRTINATLSKTNARRTIAEWFRKSV